MPSNKKYDNELAIDYKIFDQMSKTINSHYKTITDMRKKIAKNKNASSDLKFEFLESLDIILDHIKKASEELDKSKKVIKEL
jgi:hypothetical protein